MSTDSAQRPDEIAQCESVSEIKPFDGDEPLRCLLVAPHPFYLHYAALPGLPDRFWTWADKHREHPCSSPDCPGDSRYAAPGRGHYVGCNNRWHVPTPPASTGGGSSE